MDKAEFIKRYFAFVDAVGLNALQARVGRHGTLLLLGLRNHIRDLDLELTPKRTTPSSTLIACAPTG